MAQEQLQAVDPTCSRWQGYKVRTKSANTGYDEVLRTGRDHSPGKLGEVSNAVS
jgi:hypothetical protein